MVNSPPQYSGKRQSILMYAAYTFLVIVGIALAVLIFWPLTDILTRHDIRGIPPAQRGGQFLSALDAARGQIFQVCAGVLAFGGFIYTIRNFGLSREQSELNRQTLELGVQGQMTDRFSRAVDQIGSDQLEVRVGGIYALERLAADSDRAYDKSVAVEVISAFLRTHAAISQGSPASSPPSADVRAAMTVIARRDPAIDYGQINLRGIELAELHQAPRAYFANIDFTGAVLARAKLPKADFTGSIMNDIDMSDADLSDAELADVSMMRARLNGADLTRARLARANLSGARMNSAHLTRADLTGSHLGSVESHDSDLTEADLTGANLTGTDQVSADFTAAKFIGATMRKIHGHHAGFNNAKLAGANLAEADLTEARLAEADLSGAICTNCRFDGANVIDAVFVGANLAGVDLIALNRRSPNLDGARVDIGATPPRGWIVDPQTGCLVRDDTDR